ncbi:hypothetical protein AgCh_039356 [Apium graveolens]
MGVNPSYMWRSILSAKDAIKVGCRRRIGDGASTKVWKMSWLPCEENGCVSTAVIPELQDNNVQHLMHTNTNTWDSDLLAELFDDRDCQLIQRVPISLGQRSDSRFWLHDPRKSLRHESIIGMETGSDLDNSKKQPVYAENLSWSRPPVGWITVNVDAALCWDNCVGVGAVIRDSEEKFVRARCGRINDRWQPREAEALSLKIALS